MMMAWPVRYSPFWRSSTSELRMVMMKTMVLPVPDLDWQSRSQPCSAVGMAYICTWLGWSNLHSLITRLI